MSTVLWCISITYSIYFQNLFNVFPNCFSYSNVFPKLIWSIFEFQFVFLTYSHMSFAFLCISKICLFCSRCIFVHVWSLWCFSRICFFYNRCTSGPASRHPELFPIAISFLWCIFRNFLSLWRISRAIYDVFTNDVSLSLWCIHIWVWCPDVFP